MFTVRARSAALKQHETMPCTAVVRQTGWLVTPMSETSEVTRSRLKSRRNPTTPVARHHAGTPCRARASGLVVELMGVVQRKNRMDQRPRQENREGREDKGPRRPHRCARRSERQPEIERHAAVPVDQQASHRSPSGRRGERNRRHDADGDRSEQSWPGPHHADQPGRAPSPDVRSACCLRSCAAATPASRAERSGSCSASWTIRGAPSGTRRMADGLARPRLPSSGLAGSERPKRSRPFDPLAGVFPMGLVVGQPTSRRHSDESLPFACLSSSPSPRRVASPLAAGSEVQLPAPRAGARTRSHSDAYLSRLYGHLPRRRHDHHSRAAAVGRSSALAQVREWRGRGAGRAVIRSDAIDPTTSGRLMRRKPGSPPDGTDFSPRGSAPRPVPLPTAERVAVGSRRIRRDASWRPDDVPIPTCPSRCGPVTASSGTRSGPGSPRYNLGRPRRRIECWRRRRDGAAR